MNWSRSSGSRCLASLPTMVRPPCGRISCPGGDDLRRLKETVLADVLRRTVITSAKQTAALQGMGGIGKSVLAAAFGRAINTRRAMGDGILWLTAGQDATKLTLLTNIKAVETAFGDADAHYVDEVSAQKRLPDVLADKVCLIILDDVWSIEQVEPFRNALRPRCRLLVTTRDGSLVTALGAEEHRVDVLSEEQALALLAEWSGEVRETLAEGARQVVEGCGNLGSLWCDGPRRYVVARSSGRPGESRSHFYRGASSQLRVSERAARTARQRRYAGSG